MFRKSPSPQQFRALLENMEKESRVKEFPIWRRTLFGFQRSLIIENTYDEFKECACDNGTFNRHHNERRQTIENQIATQAIETFRFASNVIYLSLGAGELLQDFILCAKLLILGYSLKARLIEIQQTELKRVLPKFISLLSSLARQLGLQFEAETFASIDDYKKQHPDEKTHIGSAIDFETATTRNGIAELHKAHQLLDEHGFFYLAFDDYDFMFNKNHCFYDHYNGANFFGWRPSFDEKRYNTAKQIPERNTQTDKPVDTPAHSVENSIRSISLVKRNL